MYLFLTAEWVMKFYITHSFKLYSRFKLCTVGRFELQVVQIYLVLNCTKMDPKDDRNVVLSLLFGSQY